MAVRFGLIISFIFFLALAAKAATHYVTVNGSNFSPDTLTIDVGDTVVWENTDDTFSHTTTSDLSFFNPNYWDGLLVSQGDTYGVTFNNTGVFTYHDKQDSGTGSITVTLPAPPGILLEAPRLQGSQFLFDATGLTVGKTNVLMATTNLTSWVAIHTNVAVATSLTFTNPTALTHHFFRLLELP